jgi:hypothetical protein
VAAARGEAAVTRDELHWLLPGLHGQPAFADRARRANVTPSLDLALARGRVTAGAGRDFATSIVARLGQPLPADGDLPSAAYCRLGAGLAVQPGDWWCHADPVMLRAGRDRVLVFDLQPSELPAAEAADLLQELARHFGPLGWRFEAAAATRWYARLPAPLAVSTRPMVEVVGRSLGAHLPEGPDAARLRAWLNEAQMVLHHADVNRARELRGEHPVNGLWLWGGGSLPPPSPCGAVAVCPADDLTRGVALHAGCGLVDARDVVGRSGLVLYPDLALQRSALDDDAEAWWTALAAVEQRCAALLEALSRRLLDAVVVDGCKGSAWRLDRPALRRFWRRPAGALGRLLARGEPG